MGKARNLRRARSLRRVKSPSSLRSLLRSSLRSLLRSPRRARSSLRSLLRSPRRARSSLRSPRRARSQRRVTRPRVPSLPRSRRVVISQLVISQPPSEQSCPNLQQRSRASERGEPLGCCSVKSRIEKIGLPRVNLLEIRSLLNFYIYEPLSASLQLFRL